MSKIKFTPGKQIDYQIREQNDKFYCFILDDDGEVDDIIGRAYTLEQARALCEKYIDDATFNKKQY